MKTCFYLPYLAARRPGYDLLGFTTGMDGSTAKRNQTIGLQVMEAALLGSGHAPKQQFSSVDAFKAYLANKGMILIDATEQRTQRPVEGEYQKSLYSGKKSAYGEDLDYGEV